MAITPGSPSHQSVVEDLPFHLARTALAFRRFNDRTLHAVGLQSQAPGLASILHVLQATGDCTINCLVGQTHLPNGTLTGLLDSLEQDGCIKRVRNPNDGRSWHIRLTSKGRTLCTKLQQRHRLVMNVFADVLSESETAELKRLLTRVTDRMRAYHGERLSNPPKRLPQSSATTSKDKVRHAKPTR